MKKIFLLLSIMLCTVAVQAQVKMLKLAANQPTSEQNAETWFKEIYGNDNVITDLSTLSYGENCKVLWIIIDRDNASAVTNTDKIKQFVIDGGSLLLTNCATLLVKEIGRYDGSMNSEYTGGQPDGTVMGINPNPKGKNHTKHLAYKDLTDSYVSGRLIYPLSTISAKAAFWDVNAVMSDGNKTYEKFEQATTSKVLGTWQHVTDWCCATVVDFLPTTDYAGHVFALGMASYNWTETNETYIKNIKQLTSNIISYLLDPNPWDTSSDPAVVDWTNTNQGKVTLKQKYDNGDPGWIITSSEKGGLLGIYPMDNYDIKGIAEDANFTFVDLNNGSGSLYDQIKINPNQYINNATLVYSNYIDGNEHINVCKNGVVENFVINADYPMLIPGGFQAKNLTIQRDFTADVKSTIILPFALTQAEATNAGRFYELTDFDNGAITFTEVEGGTEANKPYMFRPNSTSITINGEKYIVANYGDYKLADLTTNKNGCSFIGTYETKEFESAQANGYYAYTSTQVGGVDAGVFATTAGKITVKPYRAYVKIDGTSNARISAVFNDAETTGVETFNAETENAGVTYNLAGQRISGNAKGIVIVNGKKIVK